MALESYEITIRKLKYALPREPRPSSREVEIYYSAVLRSLRNFPELIELDRRNAGDKSCDRRYLRGLNFSRRFEKAAGRELGELLLLKTRGLELEAAVKST